jgi:hypothetical protein
MGFFDMFSSGPDFGDVMGELTSNPALKPNLPLYPQGGFMTPSGGGYSQGTNRFANLSKKPKLISNILAGKGKHGNLKNKNPEFFNYLQSGGDASRIPINLLQSNKGLLGKAKKFGEPYQAPVASPDSESLFNFAMQSQIDRANKQQGINDFVTSSLLPSLMGLQQNATNSANRLVDRGFTDLDPGQATEIARAKQDFIDSGKIDLNRQLESGLEMGNEMLASHGQPLGRSSDGSLFLERTAYRPYADAMGKLVTDAGIYGEQLRQNRLSDARDAYTTLQSSANFNNAIPGLQAPQLGIDSTFYNPTGQFNFETLLSQLNNQNNFALQREGERLGILNSGISKGLDLASKDGLGSSLGSILGPFAMMQMMGNKGNFFSSNPTGGTSGSNWKDILKKIGGTAANIGMHALMGA